MNGPRLNYRRFFLVLIFGALSGTLHAQEPAAVRRVVLPSLDSQVAARLTALDRRLNPVHTPELAASLTLQIASLPINVFPPILTDTHNQELWEQMADEYHRMAQESGDALVTLADKRARLGVAWSSGQVRRLCHQRLAALPRSVLGQYRQRVDAEANALWQQALRERSAAPLRRLVDEFFCSTPGDQALDLLGDMAFEQGQFEEAQHWWGLLVPFDGRHADRLVFPHPRVDLARVQAKQIVAMIFQGRHDEAQDEIGRFVQKHGAARGSLAGEDGAFGAILNKTLSAFKKQQPSNQDEPWTTFGGAATRNRMLTAGLSNSFWEDGPAWRVALPVLAAADPDAALDRAARVRRPAFHPILVHNQVLLADERSVVSYHLATGKLAFRYQINGAGSAGSTASRCTLTADHARAYVRLGPSGLGPNERSASTLLCLDLTEPHAAKLGSERELWQVRANGDDKSPAFFEGAPLVHDGRVYIALSKLVARRVVTSIVCYDVKGRQRWTREVCDCPEFEDNGNGPRHRQHLLTLAGGQIVYCSHSGAIVAVDAWTGQPTWAVRYPSRGPLLAEHEPSPRDLAPAVYADGRLFAAPLDSDRVFCIDAVTGNVTWESEGIEVVHLLGVTHGRLYTATRDGLMSIRTATGQIEWMQPSDGRLPSAGRGLIAGGRLLWPTQDARLPYRLITLRTGAPAGVDPSSLHTLPVGNIALGQGCLAIAGLNELVVYIPGHKVRDLPPANVRPLTQLGRNLHGPGE